MRTGSFEDVRDDLIKIALEWEGIEFEIPAKYRKRVAELMADAQLDLLENMKVTASCSEGGTRVSVSFGEYSMCDDIPYKMTEFHSPQRSCNSGCMEDIPPLQHWDVKARAAR